MENLLYIKDFSLYVSAGDGYRTLLDKVDLKVAGGEIVGLVGPSGSGKSLTINSILQLVQYQNIDFKQEGAIFFNGKDIINDPTIYKIRNQEIGIVFQQSAQILNPAQKIGRQIKEKLLLFQKVESADEVVLESLIQVKLTDPQKIFNSFPHELSGGQLQRCLIAMAIINKPQLLIADEPFSALDYALQEGLIKLFKKLNEELGLAILLVSHNKELVGQLNHRTYLITQGVVKEAKLDTSPKLVHSEPNGSRESLLIDIVNLKKQFSKGFFFNKSIRVLHNVNMHIYKGEILGLHGASGSGKSTLARLLVRLDRPTSGHIFYKGNDINELTAKELLDYKSSSQIIFQDSLSSMSPHRTVRQQLGDIFYVMKRSFDDQLVNQYFEAFDLDIVFLNRYRHELSGGQRQRIMIIRALLLGIEFLICDEILASLDQEVGLEILRELQILNAEKGLTILFISHNRKVLDQFCTRVLSLEEINSIEQ